MLLKEVIAELRELNVPVPKPIRLRTPEEVAAAEEALGVSFHPDYRTHLLESRDVVYGTLEPAAITKPTSHTHLIEIAGEAWNAGVSRELLPICEDNADYYCMNAGGEVLFWSHDGVTDEKWPDLASWMKQVWMEGG